MSGDQSKLRGFGGGDELEEIPLPHELVNSVLDETDRCADFAENVLDTSESIREEVREDLGSNIMELDTDGPTHDSIIGIDGSYTVIEGSGVSIGICAAVSVGDEFHYNKEVFPSPPSQATISACQGLTTMLEMKSITDTSKDMVIYDGSFLSALVNLNQMLGRRNREPYQGVWEAVDPLLDKYFLREDYFIEALREQVVVGSPKQSTSTHFLKNNDKYEEYVGRFSDRGFFSMILEPGEYYMMERYEQGTNYGRDSPFMDRESGRAVENFFNDEGFLVCFYKPEPWTRAYRLEIPKSPANSGEEERILRKFGEEIIDPSMLEPYPQWLADAMSRKVVEVAEALKDGVENKLASETDHDSNVVHSLLQGYRTEMS